MAAHEWRQAGGGGNDSRPVVEMLRQVIAAIDRKKAGFL
jgi:hypothetical protein